MAIEPDLFMSSSKSDQPTCDLLNNIFTEAVTKTVADIHFHESEGMCHIRYRLPGGTVWEHSNHDYETARVFDNKIRSRSKMSFSERDSPMDGRMSFRINNESVDVRVSLTPGVSGQLIVCRLLLQSNGNKSLSKIYMSPSARLAINKILKEPDGLVVVTGPTGSGKSTLLYSILNELNNGERNIVTIEDPVEYRVSSFHQMPVSRNLSFADGLRAALRQDPDIIMVGEIRDAETATVAIQAASTGHLVLSTMHANSAAEAVSRFVTLGVDPATLGASLKAVTAQRLLPAVSKDCPLLPPSEFQKAWLDRQGIVPDQDTEYPAPSCKQHYSGYAPVIELMMFDNFVRSEITRGVENIVNAASRQPQYETLPRCGERMAAQGIVSLEKVMSISSEFSTVKVKTKRLGELAIEKGFISRLKLWSIIDQQATDRMAGIDPVHLGHVLVEQGFCSPSQVIEMTGYTVDAQHFVERFVKTEQERHTFYRLLEKWVPGEQSLFDMVFNEGLCELRGISEIFRV